MDARKGDVESHVATRHASEDGPRRKLGQRSTDRPGGESGRRMVGVDPALLDKLAAERERIEANLPRKRWRSQAEYVDLALSFGIEALGKVEPVVDPLLARWTTVAGGEG